MNYCKTILSIRRLLVGLLVLSCMFVTLGTIEMVKASTSPTISATVNREAIEWQVEPEDSYERLVLVVVGPDKTAFRMVYEAGELPFLGLDSLAPSDLPDGFYKYELRLIPSLSPEAQELITLIRDGDSNDLLKDAQEAGLLPTKGVVLAGNFTVEQGVFVLPETSETSLRNTLISDNLFVHDSACIGFDCAPPR